MKKIFLSLCLVLAGFSYANASPLVDQCFMDSLPGEGRMGLHGMVIFGDGLYYLSHIPMLKLPHDMQIVKSVKIRDVEGNVIVPDFSQDTFTVRPSSQFSLNNFAKGDISSFKGNIHKGNFEQDAPVQISDVTIEIVDTEVLRSLPSSDSEKTSSIEISDGTNRYSIAIIKPDNNIQKIENVTSAKRLWCVVGPDFFSSCE